MYLHRYLRLTPLIAFMILFLMSFFKYMGSGPFWNIFMDAPTIKSCEDNWWKTLLYIQNYVTPDKMV